MALRSSNQVAWTTGVLLVLGISSARADQYFGMRIMDANHNPLSCVKVTTANSIEYTSDNNGFVSIYEPGLMDEQVRLGLSDPVHFPPNEKGEPTVFYDGSLAQGARVEMFSPISAPSSTNCPSTNEHFYNLQRGEVPAPSDLFMIEVYDVTTNLPIPLAEVTSATQRYHTDSNGLVAYYDFLTMSNAQAVTLDVTAYGYWPTFDTTVTPRGGERVSVGLAPLPNQIARRLYRFTGAGAYRESVLLGVDPPVDRPVYNAGVGGQDGGLAMRMGDRVRWFFGDTTCALRPDCSVFEMTSAYSSPAEDPASGLNLIYATNDLGMVRSVAKNFSPGGQASWIAGLFPASNASGIIYGNFASVLGQELEPGVRTWDITAVGIARWDEGKAAFCKVCPDGSCNYVYENWSGACDYDLASRVVWPGGMAHTFSSGGVEHAYFENYTRVGTETQFAEDPSTYEAFTPILPGTDFVERDDSGRVVYRWRTGAPRYTPELGGKIKKRICETWPDPTTLCDWNQDPADPRRTLPAPEEVIFGQSIDVVNGDYLFYRYWADGNLPSDSLAWNPYRNRFGRIVGAYNMSSLGDVYYGESDTPVGPFVYTKRVVNHDHYAFYNPTQYPFLAQNGGRRIFFAGTHTLEYAAEPKPPPTPRDHYNMFMYQLDLDDTRTFVPVPVYSLRKNGAPPELIGTKNKVRADMPSEPEVEFFAYDRDPGVIGLPYSPISLVPVSFNDAGCRPTRELVVGGSAAHALFFALPASAPSLTADIVPLYRYTPTSGTGRPIYTVSTEPIDGYQPDAEPLVKVWRNPISKVRFPVRDYVGARLADAGVDRCLREVLPGQPIDVVLDPRRPPIPSPELATYTWSWSTPNGSGTASGPQPTIKLKAGVYPIQLQVTLPDGTSSYDTMMVSVGAASSKDYAGLVQADAPIGYWRLDDTVTLNNTAKDIGWGGTDGVYGTSRSDYPLPVLGQTGAIRSDSNTAAAFTWSRKSPDTQLQNNFVTIEHKPNQVPQSLSVEAWFTNPRGQYTYASLVSKTTRDYSDGYGLYWYIDQLYFYVGGRLVRIGTPLQWSNDYQHVVGTYDRGTNIMRIYLNGVEVGSRGGWSQLNTTANLRIGIGYLLSWVGKIDEVAIYDHALPAATVQAHYEAGQRAP